MCTERLEKINNTNGNEVIAKVKEEALKDLRGLSFLAHFFSLTDALFDAFPGDFLVVDGVFSAGV
jgi:hypothetical protein